MNKVKIAECLIDSGCLKFSTKPPFLYSSNEEGPIYCDNRKLLSYPKARKLVTDTLTDKIQNIFQSNDYDVLGGIATGGIPYAAIIAERLKLPMIYIRSRPKSYGRKRRIEGDIKTGERVLLIEDLVNQGEALNQAVLALRDEELIPLACFCIVSYQMQNAEDICREKNVELHPLTDLSTIIETWKDLSAKDQQVLKTWQENPKNWKPTP